MSTYEQQLNTYLDWLTQRGQVYITPNQIEQTTPEQIDKLLVVHDNNLTSSQQTLLANIIKALSLGDYSFDTNSLDELYQASNDNLLPNYKFLLIFDLDSKQNLHNTAEQTVLYLNNLVDLEKNIALKKSAWEQMQIFMHTIKESLIYHI